MSAGPMSAGPLTTAPRVTPTVWREAEDERLVDFRPVRKWTGFTFRSVRRHPVIAVLAFIVVLPLMALLMLGEPGVYRSSAELQVRSGDAGGGVLSEDFGAEETRTIVNNASAAIFRKASLEAIVDNANLVERQHVGEPTIARYRRSIMETLRGKPSEVVARATVLQELRQSILLFPDADRGTLGIQVVWSNPEDAQRIAELARDAFLADRRAVEIQPIEAGISVLEGYVADAQALVDQRRAAFDYPEGSTEPLPEGSPMRVALEELAAQQRQLVDANQQLDAADLAFRFRYQEVDPPSFPPGNETSGVKTLLLVLVASAILVIGLCAVIDIARGRVVEGWQVERYGIESLGDVRVGPARGGSA
jgi:hypothetical protein